MRKIVKGGAALIWLAVFVGGIANAQSFKGPDMRARPRGLLPPGVTSSQGTGPKVQLSAGPYLNGDVPQYDPNGNLIDSGAQMPSPIGLFGPVGTSNPGGTPTPCAIPTGAVHIALGTSFSTMNTTIAGQPAGTNFYFDAGTYSGTTGLVLLAGDGIYGAAAGGTIFDGTSAAGSVGSGAAVNDQAVANLTICGIVFQNYSPTHNTNGLFGVGNNSVIENNEIKNILVGQGIELNTVTGVRVMGNYVHDIYSNCIDNYQTTNQVTDHNELARCNESNLLLTGGTAAAAGMKEFQSTGIIVSNNFVHDSNGTGIWSDTDTVNGHYFNNLVEANGGACIDEEIDCSGAQINNNLCNANGANQQFLGSNGANAGQLYLSDATNANAFYNVLLNGFSGIAVFNDPTRGSSVFNCSSYFYAAVGERIHDNYVAGIENYMASLTGGASLQASITLAHNHYCSPGGAATWDLEGAFYNFPGWQGSAAYGRDPDGTGNCEFDPGLPTYTKLVSAALTVSTTATISPAAPAIGVMHDKDVLTAAISWNVNSGTLTPPAGWVLIDASTSTAPQLSVYRHVVPTALAEPATYTWTCSTTCKPAIVLKDWSGVSNTTPIGAHAHNQGSSTAPVGPSITTSASSSWMDCSYGLGNTLTVTPTSTGTLAGSGAFNDLFGRVNSANGTSMGLWNGDKLVPTVGATAVETATMTTGAWGTVCYELLQAP